jgi:uncharacterized membrane protein SirB2
MTDLHKKLLSSRRGHLVAAIIDITLFYLVGSVALDTASMWAYLAAIILFVAAIVHFVNIMKLSTASHSS